MKDKFLNTFKETLEISYKVEMTDEFKSYPEWDSLGHMSLIAMLDSEFGIQIENSVFEKMKTVQDVYNYVQLHLSK